jgi:hypothetical protein
MPHGDFTFDPFHYRDGVSRVLIQQGRVQLDSDANEQTETILRFLRNLARDVIGPHGGVGDSFFIELAGSPAALRIRRGEYYVDGIRCVLPQDGELWEIIDDESKAAQRQALPLEKLANYVAPGAEANGKELLLYLDVFERHISSAEDDTLREVALLGADTASRAVIVWQIRALILDAEFRELMSRAAAYDWPFVQSIDDLYAALNVRLRTGIRMRAQAIGSDSTNPCIISPEARYRGTENRLFRVEIHDEGTAPGIQPVRPPAFKWSADNGSIVYPIVKVDGTTLHLGSLGRDARTQLCVNDWVEVVDDDVVLHPRPHPLLQVHEVHPETMTVVLSAPPDAPAGSQPAKRPILRRWASDLVPIRPLTPEQWIELADGVQVAFSRLPHPEAGFRSGDYWLIPTRTANGELAWPRDDQGAPLAMPPNGIEHHYAPLASWAAGRATATSSGTVSDLRRTFEHLAGLPKPPKA